MQTTDKAVSDRKITQGSNKADFSYISVLKITKSVCLET